MLSYLIGIISPNTIENRLPRDEKTDRHEDNRWNRKQRKNLKKPTLAVVNDGPPDTEYLHYRLNLERVSQKSSLLPAHIR